MANAGAAIADIWPADERGIATNLYSSGPWFGPSERLFLCGAWWGLTIYSHWAYCRSKHENMFPSKPPSSDIFPGLFSPVKFGMAMGILDYTHDRRRPISDGNILHARECMYFLPFPFTYWIINVFLDHPQYTPVLLRRRARKLHAESGNTIYYISKYDLNRTETVTRKLSINMRRPIGRSSSVFMRPEYCNLNTELYFSISTYRTYCNPPLNLHCSALRFLICNICRVSHRIPNKKALGSRSWWTRIPGNRIRCCVRKFFCALH